MNKRKRINNEKKKGLGLKIPQITSKFIYPRFVNYEYLPKDGLC